jgi:Fibronectin type III domain
MTAKLPMIGCLLRGPAHISGGIVVPPAGYEAVVHGAIFPAHHVDMMPNAGPLNGGSQSIVLGPLQNLVSAVRAYNNGLTSAQVTAGWKQYIRIRCEWGGANNSGNYGAAWVRNLSSGPVAFTTSGGTPKAGWCPVWWDTPAQNAYRDWIGQLGAYVDSVPEILEVAPGMSGMYTAECFVRWSKPTLAAWSGGGGNLTSAKDQAAMQTMIDIHTTAHPNTWTLLDINAYESVDGNGTNLSPVTVAVMNEVMSSAPSFTEFTNASMNITGDTSVYALMQTLGPLGSGAAVLSCQTMQGSVLTSGGEDTVAGRTALYQRIAGNGTTTHGFGMSSCELPDTNASVGDTVAVITAFDTALKANFSGSIGPPPPPPGSITQVGTTWGAAQSGSGAGAVTQDGSSWGNLMTANAATLVLPAHTLVVGEVVIVCIGDRVSTATTITSVTDALSNTYTRQAFKTSSPLRGEVWTCNVTTGGSTAITITPASTVSECSAVASQWIGLANGTVDTFVGNGGTAPTTSTATAAASTAGDLVIGMTVALGNGAPTPALSAQAFTAGAGSDTPFHVPDLSEQSTGGNAVLVQVSETLAGSTGTQQYSASITGTGAWLNMVASFQAAGASTAALTLPAHTVTTGDTVLVSIGDRVSGGTTISTVVDSNNASNVFTLIPSAAGGTSPIRGEVWKCASVIGGSMVLVITPVSAVSTCEARASEWSGLGAVDKVVVATGTAPASATATTAATTVAGDLVYATIVGSGSPTYGTRAFTPTGTDFYKPDTAEQGSGSLNSLLETSATLAGGTSTEQYSATITGTLTWVCIVVAIKGASAGATAPDTITGVSASPGDASALVTWNVPANNGAAIDLYTGTGSPGGNFTVSGSPPTPSTTVTGLTNGTPYTWTLTAHNSAGTSGASAASTAVTPVAAVVVVPPVTTVIVQSPPSAPTISARYVALLKGTGT